MVRREVKQGDIVKLNLNPIAGHEQAGYRPVLVVSNNECNKVCGGVVKVVPITTNSKDFPLHLEIPEGLNIHGKLEIEHERSIDIVSRGYRYFCSVPEDFLNKVLNRIKMTY